MAAAAAVGGGGNGGNDKSEAGFSSDPEDNYNNYSKGVA